MWLNSCGSSCLYGVDSILLPLIFPLSLCWLVVNYVWIFTCFNLLVSFFETACWSSAERVLSFMVKRPSISAYQAHLFFVTGGGGYTYLSEPLWWAGMTTSKHVPRQIHRVNLNFSIQLIFLSVDLGKCCLGRLQTLLLIYSRQLCLWLLLEH